MNKAKLKSYAPQARKDFIAAVTARAHLLGLSEKGGKCRPAYPDTHKTSMSHNECCDKLSRHLIVL